ncbi:hypothetical protein [Edaphobacter modestus]|uniref:Flagellar hook-length control protein FliK n=1 Tax=Edaphobacter modestus TaxID=388466 RepID=A0A4Q7YP95_9BACT|nr:hypothetical protein [Edaphobacter modestus]RZU39582.1 hypothetical protein BDD14_0968 [Edaphobacter modestus]
MKIAGVLGTEEMRGSLIVPGHAGSNPQSMSFAESFGKDVTAGAEKELLSERNLRVGIPVRGDAATKNPIPAWTTEPELTGTAFTGQAGEGSVPTPTMRIASQLTKNIADGVTRQDTASPAEGSSPAEEASILPSAEGVSTDIAGKALAGQKSSLAVPPEPQSMPKAEDAAAAKQELPVPNAGTPRIGVGLADALIVALKSGTGQAPGHRLGEDKSEVKSRGDGTHPKVMKKISNGDSAAGAVVVEDTQAMTVAPVSQAVTVASTEVLPKAAATESAATGELASVSPVGTATRKEAGGVQKTQATGAADSSVPVKAERTTERENTVVLPPKDSGTDTHDTRSATEQRGPGDASDALHQPEKTHAGVTEVPPGMTSTVTQVHEHALTIPSGEKGAPANVHPESGQGDAVSTSSHLDGSGEHKVLTATPTALEVGVPGGTHGWLKVRAELADDGAVHASVSSSSAAGTEMLRRDLPSLTSYLHQEQVAVNSVVVHPPSSVMDQTNLSGGGSQNHEAGRGSSDPQADSGRQSASGMSRNEDGSRQGSTEDEGGAVWPSSVGYAGAGGWLSVRA